MRRVDLPGLRGIAGAVLRVGRGRWYEPVGAGFPLG